MEDNLRTFREEWPLTSQERSVLLEIAENLKKGVPCTACRYCCDGCPVGLDIPYLLQCYNDYKFAQSLPPSMRIDALEEEKRPAACIGCGQCMHACPQGIDVPAALAELAEMYEKGPHWSEQVKLRQKPPCFFIFFAVFRHSQGFISNCSPWPIWLWAQEALFEE